MTIRDRIVELRRIKASELLPNPKNWRRHPKEQSAALKGLLQEIGYAGALLARELPDGKLMLIDGHLRRDTTPKSIVPVLVLDVTEAEADKILLTYDPLSAMAQADKTIIDELLKTVTTENEAVRALLAHVADSEAWQAVTSASSAGLLTEQFLVPPFSVLDARQGYWQDRKRAWLALGIESELGRGGSVGAGGNTSSSANAMDYAGGFDTRFRGGDASPGGRPRPAMKLGAEGKTLRGDGRGRQLAKER